MRKISLFIATSLDGYIAKPNDDLREIGPSHYDNGQRDVYVITRTERPQAGRTIFHTGNISELVKRLKSEKGKNIYCDGGAEVIDELLKQDLIDEFIISVIPVLLGDGTRLFKDGRPEQILELISVKAFETGLTQLHYKKKK